MPYLLFLLALAGLGYGGYALVAMAGVGPRTFFDEDAPFALLGALPAFLGLVSLFAATARLRLRPEDPASVRARTAGGVVWRAVPGVLFAGCLGTTLAFCGLGGFLGLALSRLRGTDGLTLSESIQASAYLTVGILLLGLAFRALRPWWGRPDGG